MLDGLAHLFELARLDGELETAEAEYAGLPARRERVEQEKSACDTRAAEAQQRLADAEARKRQAENSLQDAETLVQKLEGQQFQVKSNDAYSALLHEMEQGRKTISNCETQILECMEEIESTTVVLARTLEGVDAARQKFDDEQRAIEVRDGEITAETGRLQELRAQVKTDVSRDLLDRYERIFKRRRPAVAVVSGELCGGCRVGIPAQDFIEILRGERIITCGNCHRILAHADQLKTSAAS